jgi:hypothetical protein
MSEEQVDAMPIDRTKSIEEKHAERLSKLNQMNEV